MKELIFEYTSIIISIMLLVYYTNEIISLFEVKDYKFKNSFEVIKIYLCKWYNYFPLILIPFIFFIDIWFVGLIYSLIVVVFYFYLRIWHKITINDFWKAFRLYVVILIVETIIGTLFMLNVKLVELTSLLIIVLNIHFLMVYLCCLIIWPLEKLFTNIMNRENDA